MNARRHRRQFFGQVFIDFDMDRPIVQVKPKVLVVGDVMLDRDYPDRREAEPALHQSHEDVRPWELFEYERDSPGAAARVAVACGAYASEVRLLGVVGGRRPHSRGRGDQEGEHLGDLLRAANVEASLVPDESRMTIVKHRFWQYSRTDGRSRVVERYDREGPSERRNVSPEIHREMQDALVKGLSDCELVIVDDFEKGVVTPALMEYIARKCRQNGNRLIIDPRRDWKKYDVSDAEALVPNSEEALHGGLSAGAKQDLQLPTDIESGDCTKFLLTSGPKAVTAIHGDMVGRERARNLVVTLGGRGALCLDGEDWVTMTPYAKNPSTSVGLGDVFTAWLGWAVNAGYDYPNSTLLANLAAGLASQADKEIRVQRADLLDAIRGNRNSMERLGPGHRVVLALILRKLSRTEEILQSVLQVEGLKVRTYDSVKKYIDEAMARVDVSVREFAPEAALQAGLIGRAWTMSMAAVSDAIDASVT